MRRGFTLIELLVVIAVIGILAALAVPFYQRSIAAGHSTACLSQLRQLGVALSGYLTDNDNTMPIMKAARASKEEDEPVLDIVFKPYVPDGKLFACPADPHGIAERTGTSYYWNAVLNGQSAANLSFLFIADATRIPVLADKEGFHADTGNKVNVLYADGHATKDLRFFTGP